MGLFLIDYYNTFLELYIYIAYFCFYLLSHYESAISILRVSL